MTTSQLPIEIYRRIIEQFAPPHDNFTLAIIARTSRLIHGIAECRLYATLHLYGPHKLQQVLKTFTARPLLATYPRFIYLRAIERERTPESYWLMVSEFLHRGAASAELISVIAPEPEAINMSWVLRSLYNSNGTLHTLRASFSWDAEYVGFLESPGACGLVRLDTADIAGAIPTGFNRLHQHPPPLPPRPHISKLSLRQDAVTSLTQIDAPIAAVCLLVPGRPVSYVRLRFGMGSSLQSLPPPHFFVTQVLAKSTAQKGILLLDMSDLSAGHRGETYSLEEASTFHGIEMAMYVLLYLFFFHHTSTRMFAAAQITRIYKALLRLHELRTLEVIVSHLRPPVDKTWILTTAFEFRIYGAALTTIVFWKEYDSFRCFWNEEEHDFVMAADT
ncbi:hypothetical protein Clacol_009651 [Clathrus columnatus]|uniref:F-box domain-containing protein n=1 Tax=Clathrus columnatus TaxID=1419009 RepID=A0AAV5ALQ1_9AGAM|nr:hypothetical protein Clacol_009651 [Clathrus columnatus]